MVALNVAGGLAESCGILALIPVLDALGVRQNQSEPDQINLVVGLAIYLVLASGAAILVRLRETASEALTLDLLDRFRHDLYTAILAMEWSRFRPMRSADMLQVFIGEIGRISNAVRLLGQLTAILLTLPFMLAVTLALSWPITLSAMLGAAATMFATARFTRDGFLVGRELGVANRAAAAGMADDLAGMRVIKSFGAESIRTAKMTERFAHIRRNQLHYQGLHATERMALLVGAATAAVATLYVALTVLHLTLAAALVLVLAFARLLQMALRGVSLWRNLAGAVAALASYEEAMEFCLASAERAESNEHGPPAPRGELRLAGVSVRLGDQASAGGGIFDINADFPAGTITVIAGPSGAGKSTLADLIAGLLAPDEGTLLVDGTPLPPSMRSWWRRRVSVVPQDTFLFHGTIAENLRLASPGAQDSELWSALEDASIADFVRAQPQGLDTIVGDRGGRLSGGERQRISLARALLRHPAVLLLDEATAGLDAASEQLVVQSLARLRGKCTVLVVTHRPRPARIADQVILMQEGRIAASGSLEHLSHHAAPLLAALGLVEDDRNGMPDAG